MILNSLAAADHPGPPPKAAIAPPMPCLHLSNKRFVWRRYSNGGLRYGMQCLECGAFPNISFKPAWVGEKRCLEVHGRRHTDAVEGEDRLTRDIRARRDAHWNAYWAAQAEARAGWFDWYAEYLASFAWTYKRQQALDRDEGKCRGCGAPATEVHHLTYKRVGFEDLDDLLSVCRACHEGLHGVGE